MYKVIHIDDLPSYKYRDRNSDEDNTFNSFLWLVIRLVTLTFPIKEDIQVYTIRGAKEPWYTVVSSHSTKGAADKALGKLMGNTKSITKNIDDKFNNEKDKVYQVNITEKQAQVLINALDLYSRIGMGQLAEVVNILRQNIMGELGNKQEILFEIDRLTRAASACWMNGSGDYYGIANNKISDVFRVAWDLQQVIRYRLAWDRKPEGGM
jgi:hypothetical protein